MAHSPTRKNLLQTGRVLACAVTPSLMARFLRLLGLLMVAVSTAGPLFAAVVQVTKVSSGEVEYRIFKEAATKTQRVDGLVLWQDMPSGQSPVGWTWNEEPDFKDALLRSGLAKLASLDTAPPNLREAQQAAQRDQLGMWKVVAAPPSTVIVPPPTATTDSVSIKSERRPAPTGWWPNWLPSVREYGIAIVTFFGGWQLVLLVWAYFHRHQVSLILLGEPNTGKSWLWNRLTYPSISDAEFRAIPKSDVRHDQKLHKIPIGKYEIVPIYRDIPGNQSGEQLTELLDRRWFRFLQRLLFPQRRAWLVVLSPSKTTSGILDRDDLNQQLGALKLYTGVLASRKTPKPDFVAICVAKADLFMSKNPEDTMSQDARTSLLEGFKSHISLLETTCKEHDVKHATIMCSALKGWGTERIFKALERACYAGK